MFNCTNIFNIVFFSEWISVDKDETGGPKGKSTMVSRVGHEYVKSVHSTLLTFHFMYFYSRKLYL